MVSFARSDKDAIRVRAAKALVQNHDTSPLTLLEILDSTLNIDVVAGVVRRLSEFPDRDLVSEVLARLNHERATVRKAACDVLSAIGDSSTIDPLLGFLSDPNEDVRVAVARAIRSVGNREVLPKIPEPASPYAPQNSMFEATEMFHPFPDPADVFAADIDLHSKHLLPLATLNLKRLDSSLNGVVHFIQPVEPDDGMVGDGGDPFFTSNCRQNWVGYQYESNRCRLLTDFRFFNLSRLESADKASIDPHALKSLSNHYDDVRVGFERARAHFERYGALHMPGKLPPFDARDRLALVDCIGGPCPGGNWEHTDTPLLPGIRADANGELRCNLLPLTDDGRPFLFVGQLSSSTYVWSEQHALCCDLLLFYDPQSRISLTTFDWS